MKEIERELTVLWAAKKAVCEELARRDVTPPEPEVAALVYLEAYAGMIVRGQELAWEGVLEDDGRDGIPEAESRNKPENRLYVAEETAKYCHEAGMEAVKESLGIDDSEASAAFFEAAVEYVATQRDWDAAYTELQQKRMKIIQERMSAGEDRETAERAADAETDKERRSLDMIEAEEAEEELLSRAY